MIDFAYNKLSQSIPNIELDLFHQFCNFLPFFKHEKFKHTNKLLVVNISYSKTGLNIAINCNIFSREFFGRKSLTIHSPFILLGVPYSTYSTYSFILYFLLASFLEILKFFNIFKFVVYVEVISFAS